MSTAEERFAIIADGLEEVIGEEDIKAKLESGSPIRVYWGTAPTGKPHVGYFVPMLKIIDFLNAGCEVTILLADLHAYLDNMKSDWELLEHRVDYYEMIIRAILEQLGADLSLIKFVRGTDYQLSREYTLDLYKFAATTNTSQTQRAGTEVVKQVEHPLLSSMMYPILQALDEEYLKCDVQFGGVDQRKIFMFARNNMHKVGYQQRSYLMNPLVPGLGQPVDGKPAKMSSSEPLSKIDFDDSNKQIKQKLNKAYSKDGEVENNGLLALLKYVVFKVLAVEKRPLEVKRREEYGGDVVYNSYEELEAAFINGDIVSGDIKTATAAELIKIVSPLRQLISKTHKQIYDKAYPQPKKKTQRKLAKQATFGCLDVRVGRVVEVGAHQNADSLYVEKIDLGEKEPRTIVSGLVNYIKKEDFLNKLVLVVCNLQPRPMRGVKSYGMVLCISDKENGSVALVEPPEGASPGDIVTVDGYPAEPEDELKSKRWSRIAGKLQTNEEGLPCWDNLPFKVNGQVMKAGKPNVPVS